MKQLRTKLCKICGIAFAPNTSLQKVCRDYKCMVKYLKLEKENKHKKLKVIVEPDRLRKLADRRFQEAGVNLYRYSIISGLPTEVGHHWIYKSQSNNTRYDIEDNFIPLTIKEHDQIHNQKSGSDLMLQICLKKGIEWQQRLLEKSRIICKFTIPYLSETIIRLEALNDLQ